MKKLIYFLPILLLISCDFEPEVADRSNAQWQNIEKDLQTALIMANDSDTIDIPEGYFKFTKSLLLDDKSNIVFKGTGIDKTVLSFKNQEEGAEGIKIADCKNISLVDFTIEDASGDNIKITDTDGVTLRRVKAQWTGKVSEKNGAYAIYPVLCKNVLIENCIAIGSSDAGIYVGQSDSVIIRNNEAYQNVAGIESENSNFVEIYENIAINNTGGILVFDLPGLTQYGEDIKVYKNVVKENNHRNFAPEGNIVGVVPPGTGIMVLATRNVDIYGNDIIDNRSVGVAVVSYELVAAISEEETEEADAEQAGSAQRVNNNYELDENYNPFPWGVKIRQNNIRNDKWFATFQHDFGKLFNFKFPFNPPDIVFDGFMAEGKTAKDILCIDQKDVHFVNLDAPNDLENMNTDLDEFACD
ncbi:parallel beta-helix domain-containing protein [Marivirga harenae]|uniref:parallel beta-helix domain-containing protein n=1 Tax=Marivirga harenae TaxID=2010992 RepID=UPI0026E02F24|nr:parallel beta-helix domain-containing protein [Marivirga harenae]WKV12926.1 parallel beta-helix domain-containing protein [Marivirga harenae]|tara:strand:+ start:70147 stop:71388 length:1242 start_codon:yes stop_codon:yes gene_type:complete